MIMSSSYTTDAMNIMLNHWSVWLHILFSSDNYLPPHKSQPGSSCFYPVQGGVFSWTQRGQLSAALCAPHHPRPWSVCVPKLSSRPGWLCPQWWWALQYRVSGCLWSPIKLLRLLNSQIQEKDRQSMIDCLYIVHNPSLFSLSTHHWPIHEKAMLPTKLKLYVTRKCWKVKLFLGCNDSLGKEHSEVYVNAV